MIYDALTPPNPATLNVRKSIPSRNNAIPQAGMFTGIGNSMNDYAGLVNMIENIIPLSMASLPWKGLAMPLYPL